MLLPSIRPQESNVGQTTKEFSTLLRTTIARYPELLNLNQGFTEYNFMGYACQIPINLQNLMQQRFDRTFIPALGAALNDIKQNPHLDKTQLHRVMLEKYVGIADFVELQIEVVDQPSAFHSLPDQEDEDFQLHQYFLQPFQLFGITESNRRYIGKTKTANHEWQWHASGRGSDAALIFRKIIQAYLISDILDDYHLADEAVKDPLVKENCEKLNITLQNLKLSITNSLSQLLDTLQEMEESFNDDNYFLNLLPEFLEIAILYPLVRLTLQPRNEPHQIIAGRDIPYERGTKKYLAYYIYAWVFLHLNFSTSLFWVKAVLNGFALQWEVFRNYVTHSNTSLPELLLQGVWCGLNAFLLMCAPLLVLVPWMYGLTSMPFTLLRTFLMKGPRAPKAYRLLKVLDIIEFIKDIALFLMYAVPLLDMLMTGLTVAIPSALLTIGMIAAHGLIAVALAITMMLLPLLSGSKWMEWAAVIALIPLSHFAGHLASTSCMSVMSLAAVFGMWGYLALAIISRQIFPYITQWVSQWSRVIAPLARLLNAVGARISYLLGERQMLNVNGITNVIDAPKVIVLPKVKIKLELTAEKEKEIAILSRKLGMLNMSLNFSSERKNAIKECIKGLEVNADTTDESLKSAIENAKVILADNFTEQEAGLMERLLKRLEEQKVELKTCDKMSIRASGWKGSYQPSWEALQLLYEQGIIREGRWNLPEMEGLTPEMLKKCEHIRRMQPAPV